LSGDITLWLAKALLAVFRPVLRVQELFATKSKRERMRQFQTKMEGIRHDSDIMLEKIDRSDGSDTIEILDDFMTRHGDAETQEVLNKLQTKTRAMR
jgi:hypothetical protein